MEKRKKILIIGLAGLVCIAGISAALLFGGQGDATTHTPPLAPQQGEGTGGVRQAESLTPAEALGDLLWALRDWDLIAVARWSTPAPDTIFTDAYRGVLVPAVTRLEYNTRVERASGSSAIVEVSVYAVDFGLALGDLTESASNYLAHIQLEGGTPNWPQFLGEHVSRLENMDSLIRVMRTAPAHLVADSQGNWLFEAGNPENRDFFNAVSGGLLDILDLLWELQAEYIPITEAPYIEEAQPPMEEEAAQE
ncbi:MAG: hypothetical protein FWE19_06160 [Oscillospiraceae bacterium]|nr:hypothetical protein [Oscillospiraceae bacterium]